MTEGRLCQVQLLDDRKLELLVQPKLLSYELVDLVSSHFNLKEKEFFGLAFFSDNGQCKWLQMDRRVLDHDFVKKHGSIALNFLVRYLTLVESLTTYGVHYYEVKDKQGIPWWLGISYKGIGQYDLQDKLKPRKLYQWKQLENLYFREKKFAVEVNDPHRRAVTKRTFGQTGLLLHTWYASHSLIKIIWIMAISQHQFYLDRKQSKAKLGASKSLQEIVIDLTEHAGGKMNKLGESILKNNFITASNGSLVSTGSADSEMSEEQKKEKLAQLRKKEQDIHDILAKKTKELKKICLREAELIGKLPKEYPLSSDERPPQVRRRVGTAFKLDDLFPYNEDPILRNLESRFALQQKIVEAAKKLANEPELCKTVKKKRRRNCLDAMHKLQQIENEMNHYRIKKGKRPTQRASVIIADELLQSDCSSLSSLPLEDDDSDSASQRPRSQSVQDSPQFSPLCSPGPEYDVERQTSVRENNQNKRFEGLPKGFRARSGSLESQPQLRKDGDAEKPVFTLSSAHRSNSTEVLEDCSSYTSQSSLDFCGPSISHNSTLDCRTSTMHRLHRNVEVYGNTGSMPNLVQHHSGCSYACETSTHYPPSAYYVSGCPYPDMEPYANGAYVYENDIEGHYNVNPSYQMNGYDRHDRFRHYGSEQQGSLSQNPYATVRPPRSREGPRNELLAKNIHKAMVAEHLRGWYHRNRGPKEGERAGYDFDSGSQLSLGYQTMPAAFSHSSRTTSFSSVSSVESAGNWLNQLAVDLADYDTPNTPKYSQHAVSSLQYNRSPTHNDSCPPENKVWRSDTKPNKCGSVEVVGTEDVGMDETSDSRSSI
ncbi:FERM domain-containing protein 4B isoform X2 [Stigmatopora argus]